MIELTKAAKTQIETLCTTNEVYAVTLGMKGGGCAGFEYDWDVVKTAEELDKNNEMIVKSTLKKERKGIKIPTA